MREHLLAVRAPRGAELHHHLPRRRKPQSQRLEVRAYGIRQPHTDACARVAAINAPFIQALSLCQPLARKGTPVGTPVEEVDIELMA